MFLMVEKGNRGGVCHAINRYAKANNKCMKNYNKNKESSYLICLDVNNLYEWAMSQNFPVDGFEWIKNILRFNENFIKNSDEDSDKRYICEVDVEHPKNLHDLHNDLPFLPERLKINKCKKLVCTLYRKEKYFLHIRALKQASNHELILKKVHRVIEFNQEEWLKE